MLPARHTGSNLMLRQQAEVWPLLQVEASITELQALIVDMAVSKDAAGEAVAEAASTVAKLAQPAPAPEPASSSDEVSKV